MGPQVKLRSAPAAAARRAVSKDDDVRSVLNALRRIVRSLRLASRTAEQRVGLSGAQLFVLQCLGRQSPCSVNELAARSATDQSSVSVVVSRLVAQGYVRRTPSKTDRRRVELTLTKSGLALLERAPEAAQERLLSALGELSKGELSTLSKSLTRLCDLAEVSGEAASLFFEEGPTPSMAKGRPTHG